MRARVRPGECKCARGWACGCARQCVYRVCTCREQRGERGRGCEGGGLALRRSRELLRRPPAGTAVRAEQGGPLAGASWGMGGGLRGPSPAVYKLFGKPALHRNTCTQRVKGGAPSSWWDPGPHPTPSLSRPSPQPRAPGSTAHRHPASLSSLCSRSQVGAPRPQLGDHTGPPARKGDLALLGSSVTSGFRNLSTVKGKRNEASSLPRTQGEAEAAAHTAQGEPHVPAATSLRPPGPAKSSGPGPVGGGGGGGAPASWRL